MTRHESMDGQDPGVVGPIVWDLHCKQMKMKSSKFNETKNVSRIDIKMIIVCNAVSC